MGGLLTAASARGGRDQQESGPGDRCSRALYGILLWNSGLSQRMIWIPPTSWGSRAADCLATNLWVQPSLLEELGRYW